MSFDEIAAILKEDESKKREEWEKIRLQCFYSVAPYTKAESAKELFLFPWEKIEKKGSLSKAKREKAANKIEKLLNGK